MTKKKRWARPAIVAGGLILVVGAGVVTVSAVNSGRTAQATAEQYFAALAAGDATTAHSLTDSGDELGEEGALLTDDMLAAATERISDVSVTPSNDPGVHGQNVHVSYRLAGENISATVVLEEGEPEWGVLRTWRMREPFSQPAD